MKELKNIGVVMIMALIFFGAIVMSFNFNKLADVVEVKKNDVLAGPGNSWGSPRIYITGGDYGRGGVIPVSSVGESSINIDSYDVTGIADVRIYEAGKNNLLEFLVHDEKNDQINKKIDFNNLKLVAATKHEIKYGGSKFSFPEKLLGIYVLNIKINNIEENVFIVRSNTGAVSTEGDNEIILWTQDFRTKKSVAGAKGTIYNLLEKQEILSTILFDEEGIAKFPASSKADIGIVEKDGDIAMIIFNLNYLNSSYRYEGFTPQTKSTKYFLFMDRPLYRPGDTAHFKSIMRDDYDAEYSASSGSVTVKAYKGWDPNKNIVFSENYQISASGSVSGDFVLPEDISTGNYYLRVERTGSGGENWWWQGNLSAVSFNVEYFKKPEYGIDISVPYDEYITGDQLTFNIDGKYFYGQPIAQKEVEYTIYSSDYYNYGYYYNDNQNLSDDYRYSYWYGSRKIKEGKAMFDNNGMAIVDFGRTSLNDKSQIYTIEATFKDETGIPVFARKNVLVHNGEFGIYRTEWRYSSKVGEETSLELKLLSYKNRNIKNISLNVKTERRSWIYSGNRYERENENLTDITIITNSEGEAVFNFIPKKSGSYYITVSGKDGIGNEISNSFYMWVSDENGYYYDFSDDKNLSIKAEREKYDPSDKVKFSITSSIPDRDLFLTLERGWTRRFEVVHMKGQTATVEIPLENSDMPNLFAKAASFNNDYLDESSAEIEVSAESKKINVLLEANLEKYGPGDDVSLDVLTTDMDGNPVSAEVAVWVVDKALFELAKSNTGDIFENFWYRRYNSTTSSNSLQQLTVMGGAEQGGCFAEGTKVLMSDKSQKDIEDVRIGDIIITRRNDYDSSLVEAKVVGLHNQEVAGYLIINGQLRITPNHILWISNKWVDAGSIQIGDYIINKENKKIKVVSIEWQQGKYNVYNLEIENYHTYFADGYWVHNDKGGDGGARTIFKDVVYWNPKVITNYSGKGRVVFTLPDNLTTWVIKGIAITPDTKVGQSFSEIVAGKDIIVRPILPNILRDGDALVLSALVQNYTDEDYIFDASLSFDSGSVANQTQEVLVKTKEMEQIYWPVFPEKENDAAKFTFSAVAKKDNKISDSVTTEIPLRLFGFWNAKSAIKISENNFSLKFAENANQNKSNIEITVASTIIGSLPDAMKYLVGYPYGCMEQTTSRFVPVVIARENPDLFSEALFDKDVDDMIKAGIKRLVMHQNDDGGWSWWHSNSSDPFISAYVLEYLLKAKEAKVEFSDEIIIRAKEYFEKLKASSKEHSIYRSYALALFNSEIGREQITNFENLTPDTLATAILANIKNGNKDSKTNGLEKLIKLGKEQGNALYWGSGGDDYFGSADTSTALALRAIVAGDENREIAAKAVRYLVGNKKSNRWANTYATARVIQALVDFSRTGNEFNPNYSYSVKLDDKIIHEGEMNKFNQSDSLSISADNINKESSLLEITKNGSGQLYSSAVINEFYTDRNMAEESNGLEIKREYINTKGENYSIGVGDIIEVRLNVKNLGDKNSYLVIEDSLPAGLAPINTNLINEEYGNSGNRYGWSYWGSDNEITENGIIYYARHMDSKNQTFTYKARAISEGVFSAPPAKVALMYSPEINGHSQAEKIIIGSESEKLYDLKPEPPAEKNIKAVEKNEKSDNIYSVILVIVILIFSALAVAGMLAIKNKKNDGGNKK